MIDRHQDAIYSAVMLAASATTLLQVSPGVKAVALGVCSGIVVVLLYGEKKQLTVNQIIGEITASGLAGYTGLITLGLLASTEFWKAWVNVPLGEGAHDLGSITAGLGGPKFLQIIRKRVWRLDDSDAKDE